jgi:hypothetical protein
MVRINRFTGERGWQKPRKSIGKPNQDLAFIPRSLNRDLYLLPLPKEFRMPGDGSVRSLELTMDIGKSSKGWSLRTRVVQEE